MMRLTKFRASLYYLVTVAFLAAGWLWYYSRMSIEHIQLTNRLKKETIRLRVLQDENEALISDLTLKEQLAREKYEWLLEKDSLNKNLSKRNEDLNLANQRLNSAGQQASIDNQNKIYLLEQRDSLANIVASLRTKLKNREDHYTSFLLDQNGREQTVRQLESFRTAHALAKIRADIIDAGKHAGNSLRIRLEFRNLLHQLEALDLSPGELGVCVKLKDVETDQYLKYTASSGGRADMCFLRPPTKEGKELSAIFTSSELQDQKKYRIEVFVSKDRGFNSALSYIGSRVYVHSNT